MSKQTIIFAVTTLLTANTDFTCTTSLELIFIHQTANESSTLSERSSHNSYLQKKKLSINIWLLLTIMNLENINIIIYLQTLVKKLVLYRRQFCIIRVLQSKNASVHDKRSDKLLLTTTL